MDAASAAMSNRDLNKEPFHVPFDNTLVKYGKTSRQLYETDQNEVA